MKLKTLTAALVIAGLSASASAQITPIGTPDPTLGQYPNPDLTRAETAAWSIAESMLSVTAAKAAAFGCNASLGGPFTMQTQLGAGTGSGTFQDDTYTATPVGAWVADPSFENLYGRTYTVTSGAPLNFNGLFGWSAGSAIMAASATYNIEEFGSVTLWDEHVIKDFYRDACVGALCDGKTTLVRDVGLEVITKLNYPVAKWRQTSTHIPPDGAPGRFLIDKVLIAANNGTACTVSASARYSAFFGNLVFDNATISVVAP